jgi:DNA repair exonuclease SbcCD ATPase subunit
VAVVDPVRTQELSDLRSRVSQSLSALHTEVGQARSLAERGQRLQAEVTAFAEARETAERVSGVLGKLAAERDAAARAQVESLVTAGLTAIFGEGGEQLSFHLVESTLRNAANIDFTVRTTKPDGEVIETDVMSARGGGVAAVIGVLLRVVLILLTRQTGQPVSSTIVLDETLAMLSSDRLEAASAFLRTLVDSAGLQVIMVTHQEPLAETADVVHRLALDANGITRVTRVR